MKVLRSTLFVTATAIAAAACGDHVTVTQPATPVPRVYSIQVAPSSLTLNVNDQATLTAAVNADPGVATTVNWSTSDGTKVSVAAGVIKALASTPGVAICATSTVNTSVQGCASVVVTAAAPPVSATVSIASITGAGGLNFPVPVPPAAVAGQIDVRLNVNPGTVKLDSAVVTLGGKWAGSQKFSATQAAALRSAADEAVATQQTLPTVVISINTAAYSLTTGAVTWLNGSTAVGAAVYGKQGTSPATASAAQTVTLLLGNPDSWVVTQTLGTTTHAASAAGFTFTTGSVTVGAVPVLYSGLAIGTATANFGTAACDLSGGPQRAVALTQPAAGTYAWTGAFTFTSSTTAGTATDVNSYEYSAACGSNAGGGEGLTIAASSYTNTNAGPTGFAPGSTVPVTRLDNRAPAAPATVVNPNGRANGWVNDAVSFNTVTSATNLDGMIAAAVVDAGVGGVTYAAKVGTTLTLAKAAADQSSPTAPAVLPPTATNVTDCLIQFSQDALGNRSANPAACNQTFGVDRYAPVIGYVTLTADATSIQDLSRYALTPGATLAGSEFKVTVIDTGAVGNSGMLPTAPVTGTVAMRGASTTAAAACYIGSYATATGCSAVALASAAPVYTSGVGATMAAAAGPDYYTFNATAFDAAGNSASVLPRVTLVDQTATVVGTASTPLSVAAGFTVTAFINEDLDIQNYWFSGDYAAAPAPLAPTRLAQGQTQVNGYNAATFINTNYVASNTFNLPFEIQSNMLGTLAPVTGIEVNAMNQANTVATGATAAPMPTFTAPTAISTTNMTAFTVPAFASGITGISTGLSTAATAARPLSTTLTTTATGATAVFNNPFSRVDFYATNLAGTEFRLIGSTSSATLTDDGVTRVFTYSVTITGATAFAQLSGTTATFTPNVVAIGYNAAGTVGMVSAAALAVPLVY